MASLTRWTWVWVDSKNWWWTGRPGMLRFMGMQRFEHDWATKLNWTEHGLVHRNKKQFALLLVCPIRKLPQASYPYPSEGRQNENHNHRKLTKLITWTTALSNSMKLWAMLCGATQDGWFMVESSDEMWSTGEGNGKPLQYSCFENPMNSMKKQRYDTERWTTQVGRCPICYWRTVEK